MSGTISADGRDASRFAYAEINLPVTSPQQDIVGARQLTFTAAVRGEDYDSSGSVVTPKVGVIYDPTADFTIKASWGRSFKAPTLLQLCQTQFAYLYPAVSVGGVSYGSTATVLMPYGGNPDLKPERSRMWSASMGFHPVAVPNLTADLNWFDIDFTDRISQPLVGLAQALSNPSYGQFIDYSPTLGEQSNIIATSDFRNFSGAVYNPDNVVAIAFNRYINTASQHVRGIDFSLSYLFAIGSSQLATRGSVTWLDSSQRATTTDQVRALSGMLFYPARISARFGSVWTQGGFSAAVFANHKGSVTNPLDQAKTGSFTTVDLTLTYTTGQDRGWLSDLAITLAVTNVLDREPPLYSPTSPYNPPYDSTNYSSIGRFVSFGISKHF